MSVIAAAAAAYVIGTALGIIALLGLFGIGTTLLAILRWILVALARVCVGVVMVAAFAARHARRARTDNHGPRA